VSDEGWSDADMQARDNLDAYIARHKANESIPAAPRDAIMVAQDEALKHRTDHSYLPQDRKEALRWMPHNWVVSAIYSYAAQFKKPENAGDTRRLEWLAKHWGGQRRDFSLHVLTRGGTGDLSDIRTFVDDEMRAR